MGLPQINISFKKAAETIKVRSQRGIVACILKDATTGGADFNVFNSINDIDFTKWESKNHEYLELIFKGKPSQVIAIRQSAEGITQELKTLKDLKWNYFTMPAITSALALEVVAWIKEQREKNHKIFKAVLPSTVADYEGIINFTTDEIKTLDDKTYSTTEYCARIAGVLAGISLSRSSTYFVFDDIVSANLFDDADARVDKGELLLIFDSEHYKIARGVNSLKTYTAEKGSDFGKIKIIEARDMYKEDIQKIFETEYLGKVRNDYDSKQALVAAINVYHNNLLGDVLDQSFNNSVCVDIEAQRTYLESNGIDTSVMKEIDIVKANTSSQVFITSCVKFIDAMEDMTMSVIM